MRRRTKNSLFNQGDMSKFVNVFLFIILLASSAECLADTPLDNRQLYIGVSGNSAAGASVDGVALSLTLRNSTVQVGQPIWATVEVRNVSGKTQGAWFGPRNSTYSFTIVNVRTGSVAPAIPNNFGLDPISGPLDGPPVSAGASMYGTFRLDLMYKINEAGTYSVRVADGVPIVSGKPVHLQSNTMTLVVAP